MENKILQKLTPHLIDREGLRLTVYRDSLGKPTVGVGHLVLPQDGLKVGDRITRAQSDAFLAKDASTAIQAAMAQGKEIGVDDIDFLVALASVNFQLGTGWTKKFPRTWDLIRRGEYWRAIENLNKSLWAKQTPVRVRDFVSALTLLGLKQKPKNIVPKRENIVKMNFNKRKKT